MTRLTIPVWGLVLLAAPVSAAAQPTAPAHVSQVDGQATVARLSGAQSAVADLPLLPGDRVQTDQGRVELLFGDGAIVHMDEQTTVDVNAGNVAQLLGGRLVVAADAAGGSLQVDASPASVRLVDSGEVRLVLDASSGTPLLDVGVVRGEVEVASEAGVETVRAGEHVVVSEGEAPSPPVAFNSAREDGFFRWSNALLDSRRGTTSAAYLPSDLETYAGTLDQVRQLGLPGAVRVRAVPRGRSGLASVSSRALAARGRHRVDLPRPRSVGMADAPLRPLGRHGGWHVVLDSVGRVVGGVGRVGRRTRLRGVVPPRVGRPAGRALLDRRRTGGRPSGTSWPRLERRADHGVRARGRRDGGRRGPGSVSRVPPAGLCLPAHRAQCRDSSRHPEHSQRARADPA